MSVPARVIFVAVGALVIVVGLGLVALVRSDPAPTPDPQPSPTAVAVNRTLLLQVLDAEGYALGNTVIGIQPPDQPRATTFLDVPGSLLIPVGDDSVTLGLAPKSPDTLAAVHGLGQELDLRIDAGLTMDRLAFAGLVDAVGGATVDVPRRVTLPSDPGTPARVVGPGIVVMDGVTAADYAIVRLPGETEEDRLQRVSEVLDLALEGLPTEPERMRQVLTSLGSLAKSTVPTEDLVPMLTQVRSDMRFDATRYAVLPVDVIRVGLRPASVPAPGALDLVAELFPDSVGYPAL